MLTSLRATAVLLTLLGATSLSVAASTSVTLSVPGMTCSSCPITVKKALMKVEGVQQVKTSLEKREAVVIFDNAKVDAGKLGLASANAGYPVTVKSAN